MEIIIWYIVSRKKIRFKKDKFACFKCKFCRKLGGNMIKCLAPNKFTNNSFNAEDYTCTVYKNANDLTDYEKELTIKANNKDRNAKGLLKLKIKEFNKEFKGLN